MGAAVRPAPLLCRPRLCDERRAKPERTTAIIAQFSAERDGFRRLMNALTGSFVFVGVILIASYMLLHSSTPRKQVKHVEPFRE